MGRDNDEIRRIILKFLYDVHRKARSMKSARVPISKLKSELKKIRIKRT